MKELSSLCLPALLTAAASGAAPLHELSYQSFHRLDAVPEASGVMFKPGPDGGTLFAVGDEGYAVVEISKTGDAISSMNFERVVPAAQRALDDPEGLAYLGDGRFAIADERRFIAAVTTYEPGAFRTLADLTPASYAFGPYDSNTGLEGVAYDPTNGSFWGVRETGPVRILQMTDPGGSAQKVTEPLGMRYINRLNILQLSDIYVMAACAAFPEGSPRRQNILLLSRESNLIAEVDRAGNVVDSLDISFIHRNSVEGMTMDDEGVLYLVSEGIANHTDPFQQGSALHVLSATRPGPFLATACAVEDSEEGSMTASVTWNATIGKKYVVEFSGTLAEDDWQVVSPVVTAMDASSTIVTQPVPKTGNGFFRVKEATP